MLTIRLTRKGKKNQPFFKIVVIDKRRSAKGGRAVEELGYLNPLTKKHSLEKDRILYWISKGAKPTPRIHNLLVTEKVIDAKKINVFKKSKKVVAQVQAPAPQINADTTQISADTKTETPEEAPKAELETPVSPEVSPAPVETPASALPAEAQKSEGVAPVEAPKAEPEKAPETPATPAV